MSKFLAPIHGLLFSKIKILEDIEKNIVEVSGLELKEKHKLLQEKFGSFLPELPLEDLIDQSNIHGWLQNRITIAESRQAAFVSEVLKSSDNLDEVYNVYLEAGIQIANQYEQTVNDPKELFNALYSVLLEGMPCDRVNVVTEQSDSKLVWKTQQCVHKANWENNGTDVSHYYNFRKAFSSGFVDTLSNEFNYIYTLGEEQTHEIVKK